MVDSVFSSGGKINEDLMLDDIDINFLENYQNLEIDNIYI